MDVIQVHDQFYILATSSLADNRTRVLKYGDTFAVFDRYGDIQSYGVGEQGIFFEGTRFLSFLRLNLNNRRPLLLSSTVKEENDMLAVDLTNTDFYLKENHMVPRGILYIFRYKLLWEGGAYERIRISNYGLEPVEFTLSFEFQADFADIFEVRGSHRKQRGKMLDPVIESSHVSLSYEGLDHVIRETKLSFSPAPQELNAQRAFYKIQLDPHQEATFFLTIGCKSSNEIFKMESFERAHEVIRQSFETHKAAMADIDSSNQEFNDWIARSAADLHMMVTQTPQGPYPYAGVPWFSTPFGRDGIITALETLWLYPKISKGVLAFLAANQAAEINDEQDAEPGKIIHEMRKGEMAALKEIPFGKYYGSIDSTPLFIILAGEYYQRTADKEFIASIWPNIERALFWIDQYGDRDKDGFVEYYRRTPIGLIQQGWKDSEDSVFHANGALAEAPIALCEVQGYVYQAKRKAAMLASVLGYTEKSQTLMKEAETLQQHFQKAFWIEDLQTYAIALDANKKPCHVRTSNAGHCLFTEIASFEHAKKIAEGLMRDESYNGWGVRTLAANEARYNPMSYHNGSIWPHDNALIAYGMHLYGLKEHAMRIFTGLFDASQFFDFHRMPELFCGFVRRPGEGPTLYPVACAPQAWSTAAVFMLLQACLGLTIRAAENKIILNYPVLPESIETLQIRNIRVGEASLDLLLQRYDHNVSINVTRKTGKVDVVSLK